ncbi:MAG: hypothetical protein WBS18_08345 [Candidatus Acidiferrales bacterium]
MSRRYTVRILTAFAVLALLIPMTANLAHAKDSNGVVKTTIEFLSPATLGGTQLKPGSYNVTADGNKVSILHNGKVVAEASMAWKDGAKADRTSVVVASNAITEIHFQGKTKYVEIAQ